MKKLIVSALAVVAAASAMAIQGTIGTATDSKTGDIKWQPRTKTYTVTFKKGTTDVSAEYPKADVVKLDIPEPKGYAAAVQQVKSGQGAAAVATLSKIVQDYKMLVWDEPAGRYLVEAYLAKGDAQKAYDTAQGVIGDEKSKAYTGELAPAYWQALLKLGKSNQLENCLKKAVSSGDRASSAQALTMRGDVIIANGGDVPASYEQALKDAYLRVALMYTDEPCREARATAMQKAARCFDKLGQAQRAEALRTQAKML